MTWRSATSVSAIETRRMRRSKSKICDDPATIRTTSFGNGLFPRDAASSGSLAVAGGLLLNFSGGSCSTDEGAWLGFTEPPVAPAGAGTDIFVAITGPAGAPLGGSSMALDIDEVFIAIEAGAG